MIMLNLRMFKHSRFIRIYSIMLCFVSFLHILDQAKGEVEYNKGYQKGDNNTFRHRRSYERHKTKETIMKSTKAGNSKSGNIFVTENCTEVMAQIGGTATLPCVIRKFNNGVVSWIRKRDYHLLTVGLGTYNTDDRFLVEHVRHLQNWGLLIKKVQPSDEGLYECQVSTHPPLSIIIELRVTKALAEIQGAPDLYVHSGSRLRLVCTLRDSTEPPDYVFWFHEQKMINYDPGVFVKDSRSSSIIQVEEADKSHNGNYTCNPSNAVSASVNVHVLNATAEEQPAAMQHANSSSSTKLDFVQYIIQFLLLLSYIRKT